MKMIIYLRIKYEMYPEYFRNIAFKDTEHEVIYKIHIYVWQFHYILSGKQ